jgi:chitin disaccharide deacetylase
VTRAGRRILIVNADDFGRSPGINRGVARAHADGILTSATLMVRFPAAAEAAAYARGHLDLGLGLHVDLDAWLPLDALPRENRDVLAGEVKRQLEAFRGLVGADPTHLDSHHHVHRREPARSLLVELAGDLGVPLRDFDPLVTYEGAFYGQSDSGEALPEAISPEALVALVRGLPPGVTELGCHPAETVDFQSSYAAERPRELEALCDPRVCAAIEEEGVELASFKALR